MEQLKLQLSNKFNKAVLHRSSKFGSGCEPDVQQTGNRHLLMGQAPQTDHSLVSDTSHLLNIKTGRQQELEEDK